MRRLSACGANPRLLREAPLAGNRKMTTFNRIFTTQRLVQIIVVLGATVLMKLLV
jgi:hypothetical protein